MSLDELTARAKNAAVFNISKARQIAQEFFDSDKVVRRLTSETGLKELL